MIVQVIGANYIIGTNHVSPAPWTTWPADGIWDDIFIGSSTVSETYLATLGSDLYVVGPGDTIVIPQGSDYTPDYAGGRSRIEFNGMALYGELWVSSDYDGYSGVHTPTSGLPWQLESFSDTHSARVTDLRDGSFFTIENYFVGAFNWNVYVADGTSSAYASAVAAPNHSAEFAADRGMIGALNPQNSDLFGCGHSWTDFQSDYIVR